MHAESAGGRDSESDDLSHVFVSCECHVTVYKIIWTIAEAVNAPGWLSTGKLIGDFP
jgi:hypothetical protein